MDFVHYRFILQHCSELDTEQGRQYFISIASKLRTSSLAFTPYEQMLLDQFVRGNLTFDQVQAFQEKEKILRQPFL